MKEFFKYGLALLLIMCIFFMGQAMAGTGVEIAPELPEWFLKLTMIAGGAVALIAQLDAQISESFKQKWPWWIRWTWDFIAGNYRHSKNEQTQNK